MVKDLKAYMREYYLKNKHKWKTYAERASSDEDFIEKSTERVRKWRLANVERQREINKKYAKTYRNKHPNKIKAHQITAKMKIPKNHKCECCLEHLAQEKHHLDYDTPHLIQFLCRKCHKDVHQVTIKAEMEGGTENL
jgi:uncharacterized membrane protein YcjF (UPF0283 family)